MAALKRDELIEILSDIVKAARNRLLKARTADGLKAAEMCPRCPVGTNLTVGYQQQLSIQVDAKLIEELRKGAAQLAQGISIVVQGEGAAIGPGGRIPTQPGALDRKPYSLSLRLECRPVFR
jgi:hypothetical protein